MACFGQGMCGPWGDSKGGADDDGDVDEEVSGSLTRGDVVNDRLVLLHDASHSSGGRFNRVRWGYILLDRVNCRR